MIIVGLVEPLWGGILCQVLSGSAFIKRLHYKEFRKWFRSTGKYKGGTSGFNVHFCMNALVGNSMKHCGLND